MLLALQIITLLWLVLAVCFYGAVHPLMVITLVGGLGLTVLLTSRQQDLRWRLPWPILVGAMFMLLTMVLQIIPWPQPLVELISPKSFTTLIYLKTPPDGSLKGWFSPIYTPGQTLFSSGRLIAAFLYLLLVVALFSHRSHKRLWPLWALSILGATSTIVSLVAIITIPGGLANLYPQGVSSDALFPATFINSNFQASFYLLALFAAIGVAGHNSSHHEQRIWALALALFCLVGATLTASRAAIICGALGLIILTIGQASELGKKGIIAIIGSIISAGTLAFYLAASRLNQQLATLGASHFNWQEEKLAAWPQVWQAVRDHWFLGVGDEGLAAIFAQYGYEGIRPVATAENLPLDLALKFGLPVTIALVVLSTILGHQFHRYRQFRFTEWACYCGLLTWLMHTMFDFNWRAPAVLFSSATLLATLITAEHRHKTAHWYQLNSAHRLSIAAMALLWLIPALLVLPYLPRELDHQLTPASGIADEDARTDYFKQSQRWTPADAHSYTLMALSFLQPPSALRAKKALFYTNRALYLAPHNILANFAAGRALWNLGRPAQALLQLRLTLQEAGSSQQLQLLQQIWAAGRGQKIFLQLGQDATPELQQKMLTFLLQLDQQETIREALNSWEYLTTASTRPQLQLAFSLGERLHDHQIQSTACQKSRTLYPNELSSKSCTALVMAAEGQLAPARELLENELARCQDQLCQELVPALANIYYQSDNISGLSTLMTHPASNAHLAQLYFQRGLLNSKHGRKSEALKDWQLSTTIRPMNMAWFYLGLHYREAGRPDLAKRAFIKLLSYYPSYSPAQEALSKLNQP